MSGSHTVDGDAPSPVPAPTLDEMSRLVIEQTIATTTGNPTRLRRLQDTYLAHRGTTQTTSARVEDAA